MPSESQQAMDNAANEAEQALENIPNETLLPTARWFKEWYLKAGYKRLGKIMVRIANELDGSSR